jgi:hypothetical protein
MKVYVLSEIVGDHWEQKGVFTSLKLAQAQVPNAEWKQDVIFGTSALDTSWTGIVPGQYGFIDAEYDITEWELQGGISEDAPDCDVEAQPSTSN